MTHKDRALAEMARVTRPGGRVIVLEFSRPWKPLAPAYDAYFVLDPSRRSASGSPRRGRLPLPRRIDPHASRPGDAEGDDGGRGLERVEYFNLAAGVVALHAAGGCERAPSPSRGGAVNHVLRTAPLAMERLARHAGAPRDSSWARCVRAHGADTGEVTAAVGGASARSQGARLALPAAALAAGEEAAFRDIGHAGDMEFAQEISYIARNLSWDVEEDLSKVVGDIAAHRLVGAGRAAAHLGRDATLRVAQGAAEYWTEESPLIASRVKVQGFIAMLPTCANPSTLDKRIERLEAAQEELPADRGGPR
jgi:ubiquinone biosynthesis protein UbiJ